MKTANFLSLLVLASSVALTPANAVTPVSKPAAKSDAAAPVRRPLIAAQVEFSSLAEVKIANQKLAEAHNALRFAAYESSGRVIAYRVLADDLRNGSARSVEVQKYVMLAITEQEKEMGRTNPEVAEIKSLEDGAEFWILKSYGDSIAYDVMFIKAKDGGMNVGVAHASAFLR